MKNKTEEKNNKKIIVVIAIILLLSLVGFTLAYFVGQIGSGATANINVTTATVDTLTFSTGADITIGPVTQQNFASGAGNKSGSTTASAMLRANNTTNQATEHYNLYVNITNNTFQKTSNNAELILTITNPAGTVVNSLTGLTYTTVGGVSGFDVTEKSGLIQIASDYAISVPNASNNPKTDTWNITLTFVNLDSDQTANAGASFSAQAIIQKEEYSPYWYWNNDFDNTFFSLPSLSKISYKSLDLLKNNYSDFTIRPFYVRSYVSGESNNYTYYVVSDNKNISNYELFNIADEYSFLTEEWIVDTTKNDGSGTDKYTITNGDIYTFYDDISNYDEDEWFEFQQTVIEALVDAGYLKKEKLPLISNNEVCVNYNNHEFCLGRNYWEGPLEELSESAGLATKNKLQTEMEASFGTSVTSCHSDEDYVECNFGSFYCSANNRGDVSCSNHYDGCHLQVDYDKGEGAYCYRD